MADQTLKLSDLDPNDITPVQQQDSDGFKLSNLNPSDVHPIHEDLVPQDKITSDTYTPLESGVRGAIQGATLGFGDEIAGAGQAGLAKLKGSDQKLADLYRQFRDIQRSKNQAAEAQNPGSYLTGNIAGGIGGALALGPEELAGKIGLEGVKAATAVGTGIGAATGLGSSNADLTQGQYGQAAKDTAIGGGIGLVTGGIGGKIGEALQPENAEVAASKLASKSMGIKPSKELITQWSKTPEGQLIAEKGSNIIRGIGKTALDQGVLPMTGGASKTLDSLYSAIEQNEARLNPLIQKAQVQLGSNTDQAINKVGSIGDKVNDAINKYISSIPRANRAQIEDKLRDTADQYIGDLYEADGNLPTLNSLKREMQQDARSLSSTVYNGNPNAPYQADLLKNIGGVVKQHILDLASQADPQTADQISQVNSNLHNLYEMEKPVQKLLNKPSVNVGGKDLLTTGAGFLAGGPAGALAAETGKVAVETGTGNSLGRLSNLAAAKTLNSPAGRLIMKTASKGVEKGLQSPFTQEFAQNLAGDNKDYSEVPELQEQVPATRMSSNLYNATNESLKDVAENLSKNPSTQFYGKTLNDALVQNDPNMKNRAVFLILQNPATRKLVTPDGNEYGQ